MPLYDKFVNAIVTSNHNILITFYAALAIVIGYGSLAWWPEKWQDTARKFYLGFWLIIFLLFYFVKFE
jgi:hypothetical protein